MPVGNNKMTVYVCRAAIQLLCTSISILPIQFNGNAILPIN